MNRKIFFMVMATMAVACTEKPSFTKEETALIENQGQVMRVLTIDNEADSLVLRTACSDFNSADLKTQAYADLAAKMVATVTSPDQDGVGIAGPQVGLSRRVVAVQRFDKEGEPFEVYPNIRVTKRTGELVSGPEGCLSIPGRRGDVLRYRDIEISYTSPKTLADTTEHIEGFAAVIFQHECDHLDGILYTDYSLPRGEASAEQLAAFDNYIKEVEATDSRVLSIMVLKDNKVIFEKWMRDGAPDKPHIMHSLSKTFTSTAVGFAISEGYLSLDDKVISYFPDKLPEEVSENLEKMTIRDLLTMTCGHAVDPMGTILPTPDWPKTFLAQPVVYTPGTAFCYNSVGTYMLSAIVQKLTGEKIIDYLTPRLFEPLCINGAAWEESPDGVCCGGWGLSLKTEDLAKMGTCLLNGGVFNGRQVIPADWVREMSKKQVESLPGGQDPSKAEEFRTPEVLAANDWCQGYGYQMWRCRHDAFRADGAGGNYIIVIPDKNAVVCTICEDNDMQRLLDQIWSYILPVL